MNAQYKTFVRKNIPVEVRIHITLKNFGLMSDEYLFLPPHLSFSKKRPFCGGILEASSQAMGVQVQFGEPRVVSKAGDVL